MAKCMLSTANNPYNPFNRFDEWFAFDLEKRTHCCEMLALFSHTSDELSEKVNDRLNEEAIDRIIDWDVPQYDKDGNLIVYTKVYENGKNSTD